MSKPPFLAVCGHTNLDIHLVVKELPKAGQSAPVVERRTLWGGTAANIARHAGGLGVPTRLWSRVGDDFPATWRKALGADGVDLSKLDVVPGAQTPTCFIFTDLLERQAYAMDQGPMERMAESPPTEALLDGMARGSWLHLATGDPLAYALVAAAAVERGLRIALDPGQELRYKYDARSLKGLLELADLLFLNEEELRTACDLLECTEPEELLLHVPALIVTRAERGASLYRDGHPSVHQPAFPVRVLDPTGAGDALRSGFFAALHAGRPFEEALRWGQAAAATVVQHPGAQERVLHRSDLDRLVVP
ncbi:MAG: PfkB family carbohydrate kinase [Candidatus Thermoplasmatota archaeon]